MSESLDPIVAEIDIDAPQDIIWDTLTSEQEVPRWLGCLNYRRQVGAIFHMQTDADKRASGDVTGATHCDVVALDAPDRFAFTWYVPGTPKTIVTVTLRALGAARTRVRFEHSGWEQFPIEMVRPFHAQLIGGWTSAVLPGLKARAEARNGETVRLGS